MRKFLLIMLLIGVLAISGASFYILTLDSTGRNLDERNTDKSSINSSSSTKSANTDSQKVVKPPYDGSELDSPQKISGFKLQNSFSLGAGLGQTKFVRATYYLKSNRLHELKADLILYENNASVEKTPSYKSYETEGERIDTEKGESIIRSDEDSYRCIWHQANAMFEFRSQKLNRTSIASICSKGYEFLSPNTL